MVTPKVRKKIQHRRRQLRLPFGAQRFLSVLEGLEGGFAISTGVVAGLSFARITDKRTLIITAAISILVNGFNAAAMKYSAEHYEDELDGREKISPWQAYFMPAAIEFIIYFFVCGLTLLPLLLFTHHLLAVAWCSVLTISVLFCAGMWRGYLLKGKVLRDGAEMALAGALIIVIGAVAGFMLNTL